jgi:hypothetical protein
LRTVPGGLNSQSGRTTVAAMYPISSTLTTVWRIPL